MMRLLVAVAVSVAVASSVGAAAQTPEPSDGITLLLRRLEQAIESRKPETYLDLLAPTADRGRAQEFAARSFLPGVSRAALRERERARMAGVLPGDGYELTVEAFLETGATARIMTWRVDVRRAAESPGDGQSPDAWAISGQEHLATLDGLHRLSLNSAKQFSVRDLQVTAEDLSLTLHEGEAFVAEAAGGQTAFVLLGRGDMAFSPAPAAERNQIQLLSGSPSLQTSFGVAFLRISPHERGRVAESALTERPVDRARLARARKVFDHFVGRSFGLDLGDLSQDTWSLLPPVGDLLAEIQTRRHGTLTYTSSAGEAEDISLFDRNRGRNLSLYSSRRKLAARGPFYSEDDLADYDVLDYDIDASFSPAQQRLEGRAQLRIRVRAYALQALTLRLAESLVVQAVVSDLFGRLTTVRVRGQNSVVVNLPAMVARDTELMLMVAYAGRVVPQPIDREAITQREPPRVTYAVDLPTLQPEPSYLYSNRSYWYPQAPVSDYATATLRITVPAAFDCVASGQLDPTTPVALPGERPGEGRKQYVFFATEPVRYLACLISRLARVESKPLGSPAGQPGASALLSVDAQPRQRQRGREVHDRAADIMRFYASLLDGYPYASFTLALIESRLPGGHSPAYFAAFNQPMPTTTLQWRNDPVAFESYPHLFLAHEIAHQWWGQVVGWKNYHEQWLSEGFAHYFAALYAQRDRGEPLFRSLLRQLRQSAASYTSQGPVYLGYRLGQVKHDSRVFRALVYNKGALVLHMLRRLVGDDVFFSALRRFHAEHRFEKAGTEDLRRVFEAESGRSLERFFERWIYGFSLPQLSFSYRIIADEQGAGAILRFDQAGEVFDLPVTVTLEYENGATTDVVIPVADAVTEVQVRLDGALRRVDVNRDDGALANISVRR